MTNKEYMIGKELRKSSRDIGDEDAIKERLWRDSAFTLWWD
jgi:hypothetical protein